MVGEGKPIRETEGAAARAGVIGRFPGRCGGQSGVWHVINQAGKGEPHTGIGVTEICGTGTED